MSNSKAGTQRIALFVASLFLCIGYGISQNVKSRGVEVPWKTEQDFRNAEPEMLRKIRWLEENPLSASFKDTSQYVMLWAVEVPYLTVTANTNYILTMLRKKDYKYSSSVVPLLMYGNLAYLLEKPDAKTEDIKAIKAGLESMLKAYEIINEAKEDGKYKLFEDLKKRFKNNKIEKYIKKIEKETAEKKK